MTELFLAVLDRSVIGCYVILAILLIRILFRYSPKRFSYLLWMIAFLALILPIDLVSDFSVRPDLSSVTPSTIVERRQMEEAKQQQVLVPSAPQQASDVIQMEDPAAAEEVWTPDLEQIAAALWASGALALLAWNGLCAIRLRRQLRDARLLHENVYETEVSGAPFAVGLFHPRIYLPYGMDASVQECVLAHERIHVRRRDLWVKLAAYAVLCVHWMNPLVHIAYRCMVKDMEMSCDEAAIAALSVDRRQYANALLQVVARPQNGYALSAFAHGSIKERITHVFAFHRLGKGLGFVLAALVICIAAALLTMPKSERIITTSSVDGLQQLYEYPIEETSDYYNLILQLDFSDAYVLREKEVGSGESSSANVTEDRRLYIPLQTDQSLSFANRSSIDRQVLYENACALFALDPLLTSIQYQLTNSKEDYLITYTPLDTATTVHRCADASAYAALVQQLSDAFAHIGEDAYMSIDEAGNSLEQFLPQAYFEGLNGEHRRQPAPGEIEYSFYGTITPQGENAVAYRADMSFDDQGLTQYRWKYYVHRDLEQPMIDDAQAQELVDRFVAAYRSDSERYAFVKEDLEGHHLFSKGHYETWTAPGEDGLCVIVVDKDLGAICEADFR